MNTDIAVPLAVDMGLLEMGIESYAMWQPERHPMMLTVGGTGSGKSYYCRILMGKIATHIRNSQLYLCDFKDIDFREFADCPRRWSYEDCAEGLTAFYNSFKARLDGEDLTTHRKLLIFDEWAAFVLSRSDKKEQDKIKNILSTLLMVGRGVRHHVCIFLQRADSQLFPLGGRDQFGAIVALGNLSREQKLMLFPDFREEMTEYTNGRGQGFIHLDGNVSGLIRCIVPTVSNHEKLTADIREGLSR